MALNNFIFFAFWWVYFTVFPSIDGWALPEMACLYGIVGSAYGLFTLAFGGARFLARIVWEGSLDALLIRPQNALVQLVSSRSSPAGWGDLTSGIVMLAWSGLIGWMQIPMAMLAVASSCFVILAFSILTGSLAFWVRNSHAISKQIFEFVLTLSNYPKGIYAGVFKFLLISLIPSGFVGHLPVEALRTVSWMDLCLILGASLVYLAISVRLFLVGLRSYESGSLSSFRI